MTIDKAIKHCKEEAIRQESIANGVERLGVSREGIEHCKQCAADHRQLAEWLTYLKEAKRLLRLAIEDIDNARHGINCGICGMQSCDVNNVKPECKYRWQYADEAEKLLKEE